MDPIVQVLDRAAQAIVGGLHRISGFNFAKDKEALRFYVYEATITTGTADPVGTTYNTSIRTDSASDFVALRILCNARNDGSVTGSNSRGVMVGMSSAPVAGGAAGEIPDAPFTIQLQDGGSDTFYSNEAVDAALVFPTYMGNGGGFFGKARFLARNTNLSLRLTLLKTVPASVAWQLRVAIIGYKIMQGEGMDLTRRRLS